MSEVRPRSFASDANNFSSPSATAKLRVSRLIPGPSVTVSRWFRSLFPSASWCVYRTPRVTLLYREEPCGSTRKHSIRAVRASRNDATPASVPPGSARAHERVAEGATFLRTARKKTKPPSRARRSFPTRGVRRDARLTTRRRQRPDLLPDLRSGALEVRARWPTVLELVAKQTAAVSAAAFFAALAETSPRARPRVHDLVFVRDGDRAHRLHPRRTRA